MAKSNVVEFNRQSAASAVKQTIASRSHLADIICNDNVSPAVYHFIITGKKSPEIVYWGQTSDFEEAVEAAKAMLKFYEGHASTFAQ